MNLLMTHLKRQGLLAVRTNFYKQQHEINFKDWFYMKDETHINFFCTKTCTYMAQKWQLDILFMNDFLVIFQKK